MAGDGHLVRRAFGITQLDIDGTPTGTGDGRAQLIFVPLQPFVQAPTLLPVHPDPPSLGADGVTGFDADLDVGAGPDRLHAQAADRPVAMQQPVADAMFPLKVLLLLLKVVDTHHHAKGVIHPFVGRQRPVLCRGRYETAHIILPCHSDGIAPSQSRSEITRFVTSHG